MHYERAPVVRHEAMGVETDGGFAPVPPGFSALLPLPIRSFFEQIAKRGCRSIPLESVEATESALGLLPSMALSSAQSKTDSTAVGRELHLWMDSESTRLLRGKCSG